MTHMNIVSPLDVDEQASNVASQDLSNDVSSMGINLLSASVLPAEWKQGVSIWTHNSPECLQFRETPRDHKGDSDGGVEMSSRGRTAHLYMTS